ncbi:TEANC protein, partial [Polyodon spathula]|nr:TEANC protein [Polyodon spathula]
KMADTKEIINHAYQIEKLLGESDYQDIKHVLNSLENIIVTLEQLQETNIIKALYRVLKTCPEASVKNKAKCLLTKWKRLYKNHCHQPTEQQERKFCMISEEKFQHDTGEICADALYKLTNKDFKTDNLSVALTPNQQSAVDTSNDTVGLKNEMEVSNLRNSKTSHLCQSLLCGQLSPKTFAEVSAMEMASNELKHLRAVYTESAINEHQLPQGLEGTKTKKLKCRCCETFDCTVTVIARGTLFLPGWVRNGNPDEEIFFWIFLFGYSLII